MRRERRGEGRGGLPYPTGDCMNLASEGREKGKEWRLRRPGTFFPTLSAAIREVNSLCSEAMLVGACAERFYVQTAELAHKTTALHCIGLTVAAWPVGLKLESLADE